MKKIARIKIVTYGVELELDIQYQETILSHFDSQMNGHTSKTELTIYKVWHKSQEIPSDDIVDGESEVLYDLLNTHLKRARQECSI